MYEIYTIKDNDNINSILNNYGVTIEELTKINGIIDLDNLKSGMQIIVPVINKYPYKYYTVKKGDTISSIARVYGIDTKLLLSINGLDDNDYIYPNQTLIIPKDGVNLYLTINNDTVNSVLEKSGVSLDELVKNNENIYLREDQILVLLDK